MTSRRDTDEKATGLTLARALGAVALLFLITVALTALAMLFPLPRDPMTDAAMIIASVTTMCLFGLSDLIKPNTRRIRETLRLGWSLVATAVAYAIVIVAMTASDGGIEIRHDWPMLLAMTTLACAATAMMEECVFRGLLMPGIATKTSQMTAIIVSSVLFGLTHLHNQPLDDPAVAVTRILQTTALGLVLALMATRTKSLVAPIGAHALSNLVIALPQMLLADATTPSRLATHIALATVYAVTFMCQVRSQANRRSTEGDDNDVHAEDHKHDES